MSISNISAINPENQAACTAVCRTCHRTWHIGDYHVPASGYTCPDCDGHMSVLHTAQFCQQIVQTPMGPGYIRSIKPDGTIDVEAGGKVINIWPLDVEVLR